MTFGALNYRLSTGRLHRKVDGLVGIMTDKMKTFAKELANLLEKYDASLLAFDEVVALSIGDEDLEVCQNTNEMDIRARISNKEITCRTDGGRHEASRDH